MIHRIFVVRVGADTKYPGLRSPVFDCGCFEFVPIPEIQEGEKKLTLVDHKPPMKRYCDIACFNDRNDTLDKYVPKYAKSAAHNDPELGEMTYGDLCEKNPRANNLKRVEPGDYLFFLARLEPHDGNQFTKASANLYFIGYFQVESVCSPKEPYSPACEEARIRNNAHVLRARADTNVLTDKRYKFWVFKGGADSIRFKYALKAEYDWLSKIFKTAGKRSWQRTGRTELDTISSYTRTARCQIDPSKPEEKELHDRFWDKIQQHLMSGKGIV